MRSELWQQQYVFDQCTLWNDAWLDWGKDDKENTGDSFEIAFQ